MQLIGCQTLRTCPLHPFLGQPCQNLSGATWTGRQVDAMECFLQEPTQLMLDCCASVPPRIWMGSHDFPQQNLDSCCGGVEPAGWHCPLPCKSKKPPRYPFKSCISGLHKEAYKEVWIKQDCFVWRFSSRTEAVCTGQTQSFGICVKISLQFDIFDQVVLGGRCVHLGATAGHSAVQCCHFETGEQREKHACCRCEN